MSLFKRRRAKASEASVDMTPMLDIVFILLIFFIVTATFLDEKAIALAAPPEPICDCPPNELRAASLYIGADGAASLQGETIEISAITNRVISLMAEGTIASVNIRSHEDANVGLIVKIKDELDYNQIRNRLRVDPLPLP